MAFLTEEFAEDCYKNLLACHQMKIKLVTKVPTLKNQLENDILTEVTGISHYRGKGKRNDPDYQKGQKDWLFDRRIKRDRHGNILEGDVEPGIVTGIDNLINLRNEAEHGKEMTYADYMGIFGLMVKVIHFFSNCPIPKEIDDILNNVVAAVEPPKAETSDAETEPPIPDITTTELVAVEGESTMGGSGETEVLQQSPLMPNTASLLTTAAKVIDGMVGKGWDDLDYMFAGKSKCAYFEKDRGNCMRKKSELESSLFGPTCRRKCDKFIHADKRNCRYFEKDTGYCILRKTEWDSEDMKFCKSGNCRKFVLS